MDKKIILLLVVILIAGAAYISIQEDFSNNKNQTQETKKETKFSKEEKFILNSIGLNTSKYTYSYTENVNGYKKNYLLKSSGDKKYIKETTPISTKELYLFTNKTFLCIKYNNQSKCSSASQDIYQKYIQSKKRLFPNIQVEQKRNEQKKLIKNDILTITSGIEEGVFKGKKCKKISYNVNLSRQFSKYTRCVKNNVLQRLNGTSKIQLRNNGEFTHKFERRTTEFRKEVSMPEEPTNLTATGFLFTSEQNRTTQLYRCLAFNKDRNKSQCVSNVARKLKNEDVCSELGNTSMKDKCLADTVKLVEDKRVCEKITSANITDSCYIDLAEDLEDIKYCENVRQGRKDECYKEVALEVGKLEYCERINEQTELDDCKKKIKKEKGITGEILNQTGTSTSVPKNQTNQTNQTAENESK